MFDLKAFFDGLPRDRREEFAQAAGTSVKYIELFLTRGRRIPRPALVERLVTVIGQFGGQVSSAELLTFFYDQAAKLAVAQPSAPDEAVAA